MRRPPSDSPLRALAPRLIALVSLLVLATAASAQTSLTLYGGVRSGSGFRQALPPQSAVDLASGGAVTLGLELPYDGSRQLQWLLSHQRTTLALGPATTPGAPSELPLRLVYLQFGGVNYFEGGVGRGPYVAGGLGLTYLDPSLPGTSSRVRGSLNVGLGYQWAPSGGRVALRAEVRGYATAIRSQGSFFCSGGCTFSIRSDTMTQAEAMVGVASTF